MTDTFHITLSHAPHDTTGPRLHLSAAHPTIAAAQEQMDDLRRRHPAWPEMQVWRCRTAWAPVTEAEADSAAMGPEQAPTAADVRDRLNALADKWGANLLYNPGGALPQAREELRAVLASMSDPADSAAASDRQPTAGATATPPTTDSGPPAAPTTDAATYPHAVPETEIDPSVRQILIPEPMWPDVLALLAARGQTAAPLQFTPDDLPTYIVTVSPR